MPVDVNISYSEQLDLAIKIATEYHSEILVMYVLPVTEVHPEIKSMLIKSVNETLGNVVDAIKAKGISCMKPLVINGNPTEKILQTATNERASLILLGSGNKSEKEEFRLGTTAEKLVCLSDAPVWVAKRLQKTEIKNILCPVDFSEPSKRALKHAILLSNNFKSTLIILGVYEPFFTASRKVIVDQETENKKRLEQIQQKMDDFLSEFSMNRIQHKIDIVAGIPHEKILQAIKKYSSDLLVMGTNGRSGISRFIMGSVTEKVIRELPCSFVTTKTQDIFKLRINTEIREIEIHFKNAERLLKSGLYNEAIAQSLICLRINDMHVPSMYKLAELYKIIGDNENVEYYEKMAKDLLQRLWDKKIEHEIRTHYKPKS